MRLHTLAGLPRSGSTLLANALSQHPLVSVTGTSPLSSVVGSIAAAMSNTEEVKAELVNIPGTNERYAGAIRAFVQEWHSNAQTPVVIDKSRGWASQRVFLDAVFPETVTIMCVRDPRDVFASVERQHRNTGMFNSPVGPTLYEVADRMFSPQGMIGGPLKFAEDLIRRNLQSVEWVRYETFVRDPLTTLQSLERRLNLDANGELGGFGWDVENVANVSPDLDALYLNKFPHVGAGPIKPGGDSWHEFISEDLGELIANLAPLYMETFSYIDGNRAARRARR